ncbi:winged helix-turn-helix transcriptional regulator [Patescibacteria group bacterium]|nr:winged helix-turn-helix transcriptional regulator [Patescibacteria group bacterium]
MQMSKLKKIKQELRNAKAIESCAVEFGVIGDPTRLKICYLLCQHKELSVGDIAEIVGVSISAVSRTLKKLQQTGLVNRRRDYKTVYYSMSKSSLVKILKERISDYEKI